MQFEDSLKLCFNHALILGNSSENIDLSKVANKMERDNVENSQIERFGLFDSNQSNYNTYYPDVTAEDLNPKDSEFIEPVFRALSEVIVHKDSNPIDFGINGILKKSMGLLDGATVNVDHETAVGNAIGAVKSVNWQNAYKTENGLLIPAGINSKLRIDGKSNPKVARAIMMDPPAIHSTSVTVNFLWEKSHNALTDDQFWSKLGTLDQDGGLIRRIANKVKRYHEISLVSHGADPYAQVIKGANINNPLWADVSYNSAVPGRHATKFFSFDYKTDIVNNSILKEPITNIQNNFMDKTFLLALAAVFGVKFSNTEEPTPADLSLIQDTAAGLITLNATNAQKITEQAIEIDRLTAIETSYNTEKETFVEAVALKAFKEKHLVSLRDSVENHYKTLQGEGIKANDAMLSIIKEASHETLSALNIQFETQLEDKFPMSCGDCGSKKVTRGTAKLSNDDSGLKDTPTDLKNSLTKNARKKVKGIQMFAQETPSK